MYSRNDVNLFGWVGWEREGGSRKRGGRLEFLRGRATFCNACSLKELTGPALGKGCLTSLIATRLKQ